MTEQEQAEAQALLGRLRASAAEASQLIDDLRTLKTRFEVFVPIAGPQGPRGEKGADGKDGAAGPAPDLTEFENRFAELERRCTERTEGVIGEAKATLNRIEMQASAALTALTVLNKDGEQ